MLNRVGHVLTAGAASLVLGAAVLASAGHSTSPAGAFHHATAAAAAVGHLASAKPLDHKDFG